MGGQVNLLRASRPLQEKFFAPHMLVAGGALHVFELLCLIEMKLEGNFFAPHARSWGVNQKKYSRSNEVMINRMNNVNYCNFIILNKGK